MEKVGVSALLQKIPGPKSEKGFTTLLAVRIYSIYHGPSPTTKKNPKLILLVRDGSEDIKLFFRVNLCLILLLKCLQVVHKVTDLLYVREGLVCKPSICGIVQMLTTNK